MSVSCLLAPPACCLHLALHAPIGRQMTPTTASRPFARLGLARPSRAAVTSQSNENPSTYNHVVFNPTRPLDR